MKLYCVLLYCFTGKLLFATLRDCSSTLLFVYAAVRLKVVQVAVAVFQMDVVFIPIQ